MTKQRLTIDLEKSDIILRRKKHTAKGEGHGLFANGTVFRDRTGRPNGKGSVSFDLYNCVACPAEVLVRQAAFAEKLDGFAQA